MAPAAPLTILGPMKLTHALLGEHGVLYDLLDQVEEIAEGAKTTDPILGAFGPTATALLHHATIEDDLLFPALEAVIGTGGMTTAMRAEHQVIDAQIGRVRTARDLGAMRGALAELLATTRGHFLKEKNVLFPTAEQNVGATKLAELGDQWAKRRSVSVG
jgi:iron-sulfur cluster repair protein YtfE (RIC family)